MIEDLIERLRSRARQLDHSGDGMGYHSKADVIMHREAADALAAKDAALSEMRVELGRTRLALKPFAALDMPAAEKWTCGTFLIQHDDISRARALSSQADGDAPPQAKAVEA